MNKHCGMASAMFYNYRVIIGKKKIVCMCVFCDKLKKKLMGIAKKMQRLHYRPNLVLIK